MSADTLVQIQQVRSGEYSDWHAGLLLVLWRPFWLVGVGPGFVTWVAIVTFALGGYGILRLRLGPVASAAAVAACMVTPPVLGYAVYLGRDMWFAALLLVAGGALVHLVRARTTVRLVWLAVLVAACWLMVAARQNALPVAGAVLFAAGVECLRSSPSAARWSRVRVHLTGAGAAASAIVVIVGSQAVGRAVFDVEERHIEQAIFIYDLAAISHAEREVLLDPSAFPAQDLALLDRYFNPSSFEPLVFRDHGVVEGYPLPGAVVGELRDDWIAAIADHPTTYLGARWTLWLEQISLTERSRWVAHPGIDANGWNYVPAFPALDRAVQRYIRVFAANDNLQGTLLHAVWIYLLILLAGLAYLRSHDPLRRCVGWLCVATIAYQIGLFFSLMLAEYRFNFPCVVVALLVGVIGAADALRWVRGRQEARQLAALQTGRGEMAEVLAE